MKFEGKAQMKAVHLESNLELKEIQQNQMKASMKKVRKKLQKFEMALSIRPEDEAQAKKQDDDLKAILMQHRPAQLPSLVDIQRKNKDDNPRPIKLSTGEVVLTRKEIEDRKRDQKSRIVPTAALEKLAESKKHKTFGVTSYFGGKVEGETLGVIKNYEGMNRYEKGSRTLTRKGPFFNHMAKSSAPPWFHPGYYENSDRKILAPKEMEVNFEKMTSRYKKSSEEFRQERKQVAEANTRFFQETLKSRGEYRAPASFASLDRCSRPHSVEASISMETPFSRMSAKSSIGLKNPDSRITSPINIGLPRRPSYSLQSLDDHQSDGLPLDEQLVYKYDNIRHDNRYYFEETGSIARSLEYTKPRDAPKMDYTYGSLALQQAFLSNDEDSSIVTGHDSFDIIEVGNKEKGGGGKGGDKREKGKKEVDEEIAAEVTPYIEEEAVEPRNRIVPREIRDIGGYVKTYRREQQIYSPLKPKSSKDFLSPKGIPKPPKNIPPFPDYLLMSDSQMDMAESEVISAAQVQAGQYSPPETARSDTELIKEKEEKELQEMIRQDQEEEGEWEFTLDAAAAAAAFMANIKFG